MSNYKKQIDDFILYLKISKNSSGHTLHSYRKDILDFVDFAVAKDAEEALFTNINHIFIRSYLALLREKNYAKSTIKRKIASLRSFFRFLCR
ncbi:MAG: site-specific integrase, partial [Sporomusaceae bacterium]|nr:site-specific integrase [Sporomusaceae bacterium]